jgi:hypothetical protein
MIKIIVNGDSQGTDREVRDTMFTFRRNALVDRIREGELLWDKNAVNVA